MRTLIFNPYEQIIAPLDCDGLADWYQAIRCDLVDTVPGISGHDLIVDDEGLFKPAPLMIFTRFDFFHQALAGIVLLTGAADRRGNNTPATMSCEDFAKRIQSIQQHHAEVPLDLKCLEEYPTSLLLNK